MPLWPAAPVAFAVWQSEGLQTAAHPRAADGFGVYCLLLALSQTQLSARGFGAQAPRGAEQKFPYERPKVQASIREV